MTALQFLESLIPGAAQGLTDFLNGIATKFPDTAAEVATVLGKLQTAVDPANVAATIEAAKSEAGSFIKTWQLDPRDHPSDSIG